MVPSTPRSLVKFAAPAVVGEHRLVELEADQPPGAAGDVREVAGPRRARRRPPRRCRASRPRSPAAGRAARARRATAGRSAPTDVARVDAARGSSPAGRPSASTSSVAQLPVRTSSRPVVEALVRLGDPLRR